MRSPCHVLNVFSSLPSDNPEIFKDAPIAIQIVGRTLEEEGIIAMGEIVDIALKKHIQVDLRPNL